MKTIFLVSTGCYSDYSIRSVWSTRELAEAEKERLRIERDHYEDPDVEEFYLDAPRAKDTPVWRVDLGFPWQAGNIERVDIDPRAGRVGHDSLDPKYRGTVYVEAKSKEQAIKIAGERRQAALAKLAGVT